MSKLISCSKDFPNECKECPDYEEIYSMLDGALALAGIYSGPSYTIKRCRRFNWKTYEKT